MQFSLILAFLFALVLYSIASSFPSQVDFRETENADTICANVTAESLACADCTKVVYCYKDQQGGWNYETLVNCPSGEICSKGECIKSDGCPPPQVDFPCSTSGVYPDPIDCTKYHFCIPESSQALPKNVPMDCEGNTEKITYGYNPITTFCSVSLNGKCSGYPVPLCKKPFETGIISGNPTLYYTCRNYTSGSTILPYLYPHQKRCNNGKKYSTVSKVCV
ncbi:hypothetical protein FQA39_LY03097 [Lamprigera yunnana]|nr:hypothetical protein FQA39_LY03097 [Lamprigera yunnana]